jgi:hypothetical protein
VLTLEKMATYAARFTTRPFSHEGASSENPQRAKFAKFLFHAIG